METYPLPLALLDFVPNFAFAFGAWFLVKLAAEAGPRPARLLMAAGTLLVFLGGTLRALWKLFFTLGLGDFVIIGNQQFVTSGIGFLLIMLALILLVRQARKTPTAPLLALAPWKIPFLVLMIVSNLVAQGLLVWLAFRRRITLSGLLFVVSVVLTLAMSFFSSREQTLALQWIEEIVNSFCQASFGLACFWLYRGRAGK
jgi:hypothetical protein